MSEANELHAQHAAVRLTAVLESGFVAIAMSNQPQCHKLRKLSFVCYRLCFHQCIELRYVHCFAIHTPVLLCSSPQRTHILHRARIIAFLAKWLEFFRMARDQSHLGVTETHRLRTFRLGIGSLTPMNSSFRKENAAQRTKARGHQQSNKLPWQ